MFSQHGGYVYIYIYKILQSAYIATLVYLDHLYKYQNKCTNVYVDNHFSKEAEPHQVWLGFWPWLPSKRQPTTESSLWHQRSHHPGLEGDQTMEELGTKRL